MKLDCFLNAYTTCCYAINTFRAFFFSYVLFFCVVSLHVNCHYIKYAGYLLGKKIVDIVQSVSFYRSKSISSTLIITKANILLVTCYILLVTRYQLLFPHYSTLFIFTRCFSVIRLYFFLVTCYFLLVILQNLLFTSIRFGTNNKT